MFTLISFQSHFTNVGGNVSALPLIQVFAKSRGRDLNSGHLNANRYSPLLGTFPTSSPSARSPSAVPSSVLPAAPVASLRPTPHSLRFNTFFFWYKKAQTITRTSLRSPSPARAVLLGGLVSSAPTERGLLVGGGTFVTVIEVHLARRAPVPSPPRRCGSRLATDARCTPDSFARTVTRTSYFCWIDEKPLDPCRPCHVQHHEASICGEGVTVRRPWARTRLLDVAAPPGSVCF